MFLRKYNSSGVLAWTTQLGTNADDFGNGVATDAIGNVYVTGSTNGDIDGAGPGTNAGRFDAVVGKYDGNGVLAWTRQFGGGDTDSSHALSTDLFGNVFVGGNTYGSIFGGGLGGSDRTVDSFISKYDSDGTLAWVRQFGVSGNDGVTAVSTDALGNVFVAGGTFGDIDGAGAGTNAGDADAFLIKIHDDEFVPPVPEPATAGLMLIGILGLLGVRRRSSRLGS